MRKISLTVLCALLSAAGLLIACDGSNSDGDGSGAGGSGGQNGSGGSNSTANSGNSTVAGGNSTVGGAGSGTANKGGSASGGTTSPGSVAGNCTIPAEAEPVDVSSPTTVVGTGTAASCTSAAFVAAVAKGGIITFNCGSEPLTINTTETAKIFNKVNNVNNERVVIDGGGLVTLDGGKDHRILYQNTCDETLIWASERCDLQDFPKLVVQNIHFQNGLGMSSEVTGGNELNGGGALFVGGGTFKAYNVKFTGNAETHVAGELAQDLAGGAIYNWNLKGTTYFVNCAFEGNTATNGGAIGEQFVSTVIINSTFANNKATGTGMNPARQGTTGGGLGGAIYNDGNDYSLTICGTTFTNNTANELGSGSIFQVVNNLKGDLNLDYCTLTGNSNNGSVQRNASIYVEARDKTGNAGVNITNTTIN